MTSQPNMSIFSSNEFCDVTFIVENQSIPAHKILLAANSPCFRTMLFGATNGSEMETIKLENVSYNIFLEVLRCAYLGKVIISGWTPGEVMKLIQIADEYQFHQLGGAIAETIDLDTQMKDILEGVFEVAKKVNCVSLINKCAEFARKCTQQLLENKEAFDKLSMDLIIYLIDNRVWNPADVRLVYSIGNWRKTTASIKDKKVLLSKIDWKSLPGKYSEPLVRMFLENDGDGLQVKDWTNGFKNDNVFVDNVAAVHLTYHHRMYNQPSQLQDFFSNGSVVIDNQTEQESVLIFFREQVTNIANIKFKYDGKAAITLKVFGSEGATEISGMNIDSNWEFDLPLKANFCSVLFQIKNKEFGDEEFHARLCHNISNFEFCRNQI